MDFPRSKDPVSELFGELTDRLRSDHWQPALDVYETATAVVVQVELPGVAREDVAIKLDGKRLRIRGVRPPARDPDIQRLHQVEIALGPFERVVEVGLPFDAEAVSASLRDGILRVRLPKLSPRRIEVEGE